MPQSRATYRSWMRSIYGKFMSEREEAGLASKPATLDEVYDFACRNELWAPPKTDIRSRFRRDMARALREDYFTDEQGRTVRRYHAAKHVVMDEFGVAIQQVFWADMLSEPPPPRSHMQVALQQRRQQIVGDCHQLRNDVDYYNGRNPNAKPIRMLWDFTDDLADMDQPTDYDPGPEA